jgi:hypothetical protein
MASAKGGNAMSLESNAGITPSSSPDTRLGCRNRTWAQAAGQKETAVRLERLPAGVELPDDFPEPLRYDPARKALLYRGVMYRGSFDFLHRLSDDRAYMIAIDTLYVASALPPCKRSWLRWLAAGAAIAITALVLLFVTR